MMLMLAYRAYHVRAMQDRIKGYGLPAQIAVHTRLHSRLHSLWGCNAMHFLISKSCLQEQMQSPAPMQTPAPEAVPMHQIQHMQHPPSIQPPVNVQTPTTNSFFRAEPATAAMLGTAPPGLLQMYKSTQLASAMFNHHERPKS